MKKMAFTLLFFSFLFVSCQDPSCKIYTPNHSSSKMEKSEKKEMRSRRW
jgi:hypothetical protein